MTKWHEDKSKRDRGTNNDNTDTDSDDKIDTNFGSGDWNCDKSLTIVIMNNIGNCRRFYRKAENITL